MMMPQQTDLWPSLPGLELSISVDDKFDDIQERSGASRMFWLDGCKQDRKGKKIYLND